MTEVNDGLVEPPRHPFGDRGAHVAGPFFTGGRIGAAGGEVGVVCCHCGFETYFSARLGEARSSPSTWCRS